jgi:hypothetical protein
MKLWIDQAANLGADTIFWDEPHLYIPDWDDLQFAPNDAWACRCTRCLDAFRSSYGEAMPKELTPSVRAFRHSLLLEFLGEMIAHAKESGLKNAICLLPVEDAAMEALPWEDVASLPGLDIFGTDPYWYLHNKDAYSYVSGQTKKVMRVCAANGLRGQIWVQGFGVPAGREDELSHGLQTAAEEGATVLAVWGMHGCVAYDGASERPEVVWDMIGKTFNKIRGSFKDSYAKGMAC